MGPRLPPMSLLSWASFRETGALRVVGRETSRVGFQSARCYRQGKIFDIQELHGDGSYVIFPMHAIPGLGPLPRPRLPAPLDEGS